MRCDVMLFGPQAAMAGADRVTVVVPDRASCADVRHAIGEALPELRPSLPGSRLAVNHAYAADADPIRPGDEVALIGLVSGG